LDNGVAMDEIAVLFRSGFHSYKLELELAGRHLPFEKRGGLKLTESAHIKDVVSYLRVVHNPHDHLAWNRILLLLEKVGPKTALKILDALKVDDPFKALSAYKAGSSWQNALAALVKTLTSLLDCPSPLAQFDLIMTYYQDIFERIYHDDYPNRRPDLEQLREIIAGYDDLEKFIEDAALDPPEAAVEPADRLMAGQGGKLVLSTVHSAKGLEWEVVFVINLAEGKFPSGMAKTTEELEEERRLLYVAATRAKQQLYLVYPQMSAAMPGHHAEPAMVSRFIDELPSGLTICDKTQWPREFSGVRAPKPAKATGRQACKEEGDLINRHVRHPFFGEGQGVKRVNHNTVQIFFARHGSKTINLDYVKMEIVD